MPARELAGNSERALERRIRAARERLAPQQEAEANGRNSEQDQARNGASEQASLGAACRHDNEQGDDGQAQPGEDVPDTLEPDGTSLA